MSQENSDYTRELTMILKRYADTDTEEYRKGKRLVAARGRLLIDIKKIMKENKITQFRANVGGDDLFISFKIRSKDGINLNLIPDEIKSQYLKRIDTWIETFEVNHAKASSSSDGDENKKDE